MKNYWSVREVIQLFMFVTVKIFEFLGKNAWREITFALEIDTVSAQTR